MKNISKETTTKLETTGICAPTEELPIGGIDIGIRILSWLQPKDNENVCDYFDRSYKKIEKLFYSVPLLLCQKHRINYQLKGMLISLTASFSIDQMLKNKLSIVSFITELLAKMLVTLSVTHPKEIIKWHKKIVKIIDEHKE